MLIELLLRKRTNVYNYNISSSGVSTIGNLLTFKDEVGYSLDLFEDETIPIQFQINDVSDPSQKKSPFSKTFLLPGSKRNQIAFGFPYMISTDVPYKTYNGEIVDGNWELPVQEAEIYVDSVLAFSGRLELNKTVISRGEINAFEVNFVATAINIFDELENKQMNDLALDTPQFTTNADVTAAFNVTQSDTTFTVGGSSYSGWTLAYPDFGFPGPGSGATSGTPNIWNTTGLGNQFFTLANVPSETATSGRQLFYNFTAYPFVKHLIDKIFEGTEFSFQSTFFESTVFKKLLLLSYNSDVLASNTGLKAFGSSPSAGSYYDDLFPFPTSTCPGADLRTLEPLSTSGQVVSTYPVNADEHLSDPFVIYDQEAGTFTFKSRGTFTIRLKAVVDILYGWDQLVGGQGGNCPGGTPNANIYPHATYPLVGTNSLLYFDCINRSYIVTKNIGGATQSSQSIASPTTYVKNAQTHYQWESSHDLYTTPLDYTLNVQPGDTFRLVCQMDPNDYCNAPVNLGCTTFPIAERKYRWAIDVLAIDISPLAHNWSQTLPRITQKAFLQAIIKHFNIYAEVTGNSKVITMEPRDTFYNFGSVQDWTNKVDIDSVREIVRFDPPLDVFARMNPTKNIQDATRQDNTEDKLEYGALKVTLENGKEDDLTIQSDISSLTINSSTMLDGDDDVYTDTTITGLTGSYFWKVPNPELYVQSTNGERQLTEISPMYLAYRPQIVQPRTLTTGQIYAYYGIPGDPGVVDFIQTGAAQEVSDHLWPLSSIGGTAGNPGIDVNMRVSPSTMFDARDIPPVFFTAVGNYEQYFSGFVNNLNSQKILNATVRLSTLDIARFSFRNPIYIQFPNGDGDYFIVSRISYDPTTDSPSNVELLTFDKEYFNFSFEDTGSGGPIAPGPEPTTPTAEPLPPDQEPGGEYPIR